MLLRAAVTAVALGTLLGGCGGASDQELNDARSEAFAKGRQVGAGEGEAAVEQANRARISEARERGYSQGRKDGFDEGWEASEEAEEEFWDELEEEEQEEEREEEELAPDPDVSGECDPNYELECLDPSAVDYDCLGGSGDGPLYSGYVIVVGEDHYGLDSDGNGEGCE